MTAEDQIFRVAIYAVFGTFLVFLTLSAAVLLLSPEVPKSPRQNLQTDRVLREWAEMHGYELMYASAGVLLNSAIAEEFGFGCRSGTGVIRRISVQTSYGVSRQGWVLVAAATPVQPDGEASGLHRIEDESVDVVWDD